MTTIYKILPEQLWRDARAQGIDRDLLPGQLQRERAGESDHAVLRCAVRRIARHAESPEDRRHVDDSPVVPNYIQ